MSVSKHQQLQQGFVSSAASVLDQAWDREPGALSVSQRRELERARLRREKAAAAAAEGDRIVAAREAAAAARKAAASAEDAQREALHEELRGVLRSIWS